MPRLSLCLGQQRTDALEQRNDTQHTNLMLEQVAENGAEQNKTQRVMANGATSQFLELSGWSRLDPTYVPKKKISKLLRTKTMIGQMIIAANNFRGWRAFRECSGRCKLNRPKLSTTLGTNALTGGLYKSLCSVGTLFAVGSLTLFMVQWGKQMLNNEEQKAIPELIWPLIVALLLSNNGKVLASSTMALRGYVNTVNNYILEYTAADADLRAAYQQGIGQAAVEACCR